MCKTRWQDAGEVCRMKLLRLLSKGVGYKLELILYWRVCKTMMLEYIDAGASYIYCIYLKQLLEHCARPHKCLTRMPVLFGKGLHVRFCLWTREVMWSVESYYKRLHNFTGFFKLCVLYFSCHMFRWKANYSMLDFSHHQETCDTF